jgi:hypothetical protein
MDAAQWHYHPTIPDLDLAVAPLKASSDIFDIHFCETNKAFLTDEYVRENNIGAGDDVCVVGLLTRHFGRTSNIPIVRYGNIAAMPEEPVDLGPLYGMHHAYLIESRSIGGLSGSPVYLPIPPFRTYNGDIRAMTGHPITLLLGINIGLFETLAHADRIPGESLSERDAFLETMDAGIAVVLPASRLLEIINQPELAEMRKASLEKQQKGTGFKPTSAARARPEVATLAEPEPDNPAHKEDFTALLGEAGQSRSEGD